MEEPPQLADAFVALLPLRHGCDRATCPWSRGRCRAAARRPTGPEPARRCCRSAGPCTRRSAVSGIGLDQLLPRQAVPEVGHLAGGARCRCRSSRCRPRCRTTCAPACQASAANQVAVGGAGRSRCRRPSCGIVHFCAAWANSSQVAGGFDVPLLEQVLAVEEAHRAGRLRDRVDGLVEDALLPLPVDELVLSLSAPYSVRFIRPLTSRNSGISWYSICARSGGLPALSAACILA